jgi:hypothetical protein
LKTIADKAEVKIRAERRAGELLQSLKLTTGRPSNGCLPNNGDLMSPFLSSGKLAQIGVSKIIAAWPKLPRADPIGDFWHWSSHCRPCHHY